MAEQANEPEPKGKRARLEQADPSIKLEIEDTEHMSLTYVRTRHKNVRCFPRCSAVHKTKSFCGSCVYVSVRGKAFRREDTIIVGEFRSTKSQPSLQVNQELESLEFSENFTEGVLLKQDGDHMSFAINPVRKWKFDSKLRPTDFYVFTVFLVVENKIMAIKETPSFSIIPIWKTEGAKEDDGEEEEGATSQVPQASSKDFSSASAFASTPPSPPPKASASPPALSTPSLSSVPVVTKPRPTYVSRLLPDQATSNPGVSVANMGNYDFSQLRSGPTHSPPTLYAPGLVQPVQSYGGLSAIHDQQQQQMALYESMLRQQQQQQQQQPARTWAPQPAPWGSAQQAQPQLQHQQPSMGQYGLSLSYVPAQYSMMPQYPL